jgi:cation transport ATPase
MFALISIGTGAAYLYNFAAGLFRTFIPADFRRDGAVRVDFEAARVIVTFVLL